MKEKKRKENLFHLLKNFFFLLYWNTLQETMTLDKKIFPHQEVQKIKMALTCKLKEFINVLENIIVELLLSFERRQAL